MALRERISRLVPSAQAKPTLAPPKRDPNEIVTFCLGDIYDQVPADLLVKGDHDTTLPIVFDVTRVAKQIIEGRSTIELVEIYRQLPKIFAKEITISSKIQVQFPWPKLIELLRAAHKNTSEPGLTRGGALHLARLLRGFKGTNTGTPTPRSGANAAAMARAPQWFVRNPGNGESSTDPDSILEELAAGLEHLAPEASQASNSPADHIEASDELALTLEENARLRKDLDERDQEIESLRKTLAELETAAIDQIAALNQQCEEYEIAKAKPAPPEHEEAQLNPQQTAMIDSLSQQVAELFLELDRAREDALQATAAHARYREQNEGSENDAKSMQQYLASVAHELERANAVLKEMEAKAHQTEQVLAAKDAAVQQLAQELLTLKKNFSDLCMERDALRGRLYSSSPGQ